MSTPPKDDEDDLSDPGRDLWPEPEDGPQPDYELEEPNPNEDQDALDGRAPYDDGAKEPGPTDFDPMAKSVWTWFMALAWIGWRTPEHVRRCSDDYRANSWRYRSHTVVLPVKPRNRLGQMSVEKRVWGNDGPMNGLTLTIMEVASSAKPKISMIESENHLRNALVEGAIKATAADGVSGDPVRIKKFKWAHLEVNDKGEFYSRKKPGKIAYNDLRLRRTDLMRLWPVDGAPAPVMVEPDRGGRPPEFKWDEMKEVARELVRSKGFPGKSNAYFPSKSQFAEAIQQEFADRFDQHPEDSTVRGRCAKWLKEFAEKGVC